MKPWLKALIAAIAAIDLALAVWLAVTVTADVRAGVSERARAEVLARMTGEALAQTYVQGECVAKDGKINLRFSNGEASECAVSLELVALDGGETLAKTDLLDPGYHIESVEMREALPKGECECLAKLKFYRMTDDGYVGAAARQVLVTVE